MYKKIVALSTAALMALTLVAGCGSGTTGGTDNPQPAKQSCPPGDNDYSWCSNNPNNSQQTAPVGGGDSSPKASKQPLPQDTYAFRWGDYKFGSCTLALFPGYMGLTVSQAHVVILAGTGCVGFRPQHVNITVRLERWYSIGGAPRAWHDDGMAPLLYDSDIDGMPPLVIPAPDGSVPLSELHKISGSTPCKRDIQQGLSLYRVKVDIVGLSYSGKPIGPMGGEGFTLAVHNSECNS